MDKIELAFYKNGFEVVSSQVQSRRLDNERQFILLQLLYRSYPNPVSAQTLAQRMGLPSGGTVKVILPSLTECLGFGFPYEIVHRRGKGYALALRKKLEEA